MRFDGCVCEWLYTVEPPCYKLERVWAGKIYCSHEPQLETTTNYRICKFKFNNKICLLNTLSIAKTFLNLKETCNSRKRVFWCMKSINELTLFIAIAFQSQSVSFKIDFCDFCRVLQQSTMFCHKQSLYSNLSFCNVKVATEHTVASNLFSYLLEHQIST